MDGLTTAFLVGLKIFWATRSSGVIPIRRPENPVPQIETLSDRRNEFHYGDRRRSHDYQEALRLEPRSTRGSAS